VTQPSVPGGNCHSTDRNGLRYRPPRRDVKMSSRATAWLTAAALLVAVGDGVTVSGADVSAAGFPSRVRLMRSLRVTRAQYISDRLRTAGCTRARGSWAIWTTVRAPYRPIGVRSAHRTYAGAVGGKYTTTHPPEHEPMVPEPRWRPLREMAADRGDSDDRFEARPVAQPGTSTGGWWTLTCRGRVAQTGERRRSRGRAGHPVDTTPSDSTTGCSDL
jgi:hypothetical protein